MDSLIRETNENLKAILSNMKSNLESSINTLDNIQMQMDKKVEEAKKYKIQVDASKEKIIEIEESNKSLELSLKELNDKYGKMNLVSLVEAGNREIKTKINDNNREINKQKEHIAELTNKARTIKDLLINLKKDKTIKEERLENLRIVYEYYNERITEVVDYATSNPTDLNNYKEKYNYVEDVVEAVSDSEIENTMVFDEIADIDNNNNFKDEMTFIDEQIDELKENNKIKELIEKDLKKNGVDDEEIEEVKVNDIDIDSTHVFDAILVDDFKEDESQIILEDDNNIASNESIVEDNSNVNEEIIKEDKNLNTFVNQDIVSPDNSDDLNIFVQNEINDSLSNVDKIEENTLEEQEVINEDLFKDNVNVENNDLGVNNAFDLEKYKFQVVENNKDEVNEISDLENDKEEVNNVEIVKGLDVFNIDDLKNSEVNDDIDNEDRSSMIDDLFTSIDNTKTSNINLTGIEENKVNGTLNKIDDAYMDIFGKPLEEDDINKKESTLTDIFGNPIKKEELSVDLKNAKKIEEIFIENGIDFNKFKEEEQNYLKQIYDEEKFNNILNTLKRNKINLDNIYNSFNIFGEISANELESIISKLVNSGQSVEAIGLVLEKLPKVKKYNLSEAIISFGDYIKDIDITELIMKAKELYNGGNI